MGIFGIFKNNKNTKSKKKDSVPEPKPLVNDPEPAKNEVKKPMASETPKKQKNIAAPKAESKTKSTAKSKEPAKDAALTTKKTAQTKKAAQSKETEQPKKIIYVKPATVKIGNKVVPVSQEKKETKEQKISKTAAAPIVSAKEYTGKFEINKSKDGKKFFFNLYASNKVGIASSQMYSSSQAAMNGVKSVIANADKAPIEDQSLKKYETLPYPKWEIYVDNGGKYRFRLNASNGSCVCHSQGYTTKTACKNGIDSIIRSSKNAEIEKTYIAKNEEN